MTLALGGRPASSAIRRVLCYQSSQEMACIPADDPWKPRPLEDNYSNTNCLRGYEPQDSESGILSHRVPVHRSSSGFNNGPLGCAHLHTSNRGYSSSVWNLGSSSPPEPWSWHPAIESSTALLTNWNTQFPYHQDGISGMSSWPPSSRADPFLFAGPVVTEPASHRWKSNTTRPAERWYDFQHGIEPQNEARLGFNETAKGAGDSYSIPLFDSDESSFTNDVCTTKRTGCHTSDNLANTFTHTFEDGFTHQHNAIDEEHHQEVSTDHLLDRSPGCHHGHRVNAHATNYPVRPRSSSPKDPWLANSSTSSSTPASALDPVAESWKCGVCGRVLATKGTKNLNRNKRRHHCPGTGPKYPCNSCKKVFKRDDTRLLHLRKEHPETNVEPPQPRKRKPV